MLLVAGALLLPAADARAALAGLAPGALGVAAFGVTSGPVPAADLGRAAASAGLPPELLAVNAALVLGGMLVGLGAAVRSVGRGRTRAWAGCAILGLAACALAGSLRDLLAAAGPARMLAAALGLGLAGIGAALAGRLLRLGAALRWLDSRLLVRGRTLEGWPGPARGDGPVLALAGAGALALVFARHVALVFGGAIAVAAGAHGYLRRRPPPAPAPAPPPLLPVAAVVLLAPAYWLLATVAGPLGLGTATLPDVPLSPAAEVLLALPLAGVAWAFAGLWPLHGFLPGPLLFPAGALLWLRVGVPAVPDGLRYWAPLLAPAAVAGIWHAAAARRFPGAASGLALIALAAVRPEATPGVWGLALSGAGLVVLGRGVDRPDRALDAGDRLRAPLRRLGVGLALWGAAPALQAALRAEVAYGVLAALGFGVALWTGAPLGRGAARRPPRAPGPR